LRQAFDGPVHRDGARFAVLTLPYVGGLARQVRVEPPQVKNLAASHAGVQSKQNDVTHPFAFGQRLESTWAPTKVAPVVKPSVWKIGRR
jgi:hypothetical protein